MNRYSRSPKKRADEPDLPQEQPERPTLGGQYLLQMKSLGRPYKTDEEKEQVYTDLIRLKEHRKTNKECAQLLGISERTVVNYLADPYLGELAQALEQDAKERGHLLISDAIDEAVQKLHSLMHTARSEFVQYKSAEYLLKIAGYEVPKEIRERDNQADVIAFLSKLEEEKKPRVQVNVQITQQTPYTPEKTVEGSSGWVEESHLSSVPQATPDDLDPELLQYQRPMLPGGRIPKETEEL